MAERRNLNNDYQAFLAGDPQMRSEAGLTNLSRRLESSKLRKGAAVFVFGMATILGNGVESYLSTLPFAHEQPWQTIGITALAPAIPGVATLLSIDGFLAKTKQLGEVSGYKLAQQEKQAIPASATS